MALNRITRRRTSGARFMTPTGRLPQRVYWRRRILFLLTVFTVVYGLYLGTTLAFALANPALGVSLSARGAEWGREHGLGSFVTWVEARWYSLNPPKKGGVPSKGSFGSGSTAVNIPTSGHLPAPLRVVTPALRALPGEGVWHPAGRRTANGIPAVYEAYIRPDAVHTSFVVGLAWMDTTLLKAQLYSGTFIPGNCVTVTGTTCHYEHSAPIKPSATTSLDAAFNAGFRLQDGRGGYYTDGHLIATLRKGAASAVIEKDGTMTVVQWGREISSLKNVVAVRQNLDLIVDHGKAVSGLDSTNTVRWGKTLGGRFDVWRSGLGVTKNGAVVYAGGPALTISALADVLVRAGAVRAMELDMNTDWVHYSTFTGKLNTVVNGANGRPLLSSMAFPPSRFFTTWWNRDFFTMSFRPKELTAH